MDLGVLDTSTCTPMTYAFVEIWHGKRLHHVQLRIVCDQNSPASRCSWLLLRFRIQTTETWLRGGWRTDANGMVEVATVYPGFYGGRTSHIHMMAHKDWT